MREVISENEKVILIDLINKLENDFMDFMHKIEDDETISNESFKQIDRNSNIPLSTITELRNEIYYT